VQRVDEQPESWEPQAIELFGDPYVGGGDGSVMIGSEVPIQHP